MQRLTSEEALLVTLPLSEGFALCNECREKEEKTPVFFAGVLACSACLAWSRMRCGRPPARARPAGAAAPVRRTNAAASQHLQAICKHGRQRYLCLNEGLGGGKGTKKASAAVVSICVHVRKSAWQCTAHASRWRERESELWSMSEGLMMSQWRQKPTV